MQFINAGNYSDEYKIAEITADRVVPGPSGGVKEPTKFNITLVTNLKEDINFIFDNANGPNFIKNKTRIKFTKSMGNFLQI